MLLLLTSLACGGGEPAPCGPSRARVSEVLDGDTVVLDSGARVRLLLVDAPELHPAACHGERARAAARSLVLGRTVELHYSATCTDRYGRLLAYVEVGSTDVNAHLLERGHACLLFIPPAGAERLKPYRALASAARSGGRGLWAECGTRACRR